MKALCVTKTDRKKICGRVFSGSDKENIIKRWSEHNDKAHSDRLGMYAGCVLTFDEKRIKRGR